MEPSEEEIKELNNLTFSCQNDECKEHIAYKNYFKHMTKECKVKTYKGAKLVDGIFEGNLKKSNMESATD